MAVAVLVCFFIVVVRHLSGPPTKVGEPRYWGRPLSYWIEASKLPDTQGERAERIVRRAIPRLLRWLRSEPPRMKHPRFPSCSIACWTNKGSSNSALESGEARQNRIARVPGWWRTSSFPDWVPRAKKRYQS